MSLDDVFVEEDEMNEKELAEILKNRLQIGKSQGKLFYQSDFHELKSDYQLALVLLAKKAAKMKGIIDEERVGPKKLSEETGIPNGTVKTALKRLRDSNLAKSDKGKYWIPNPNVSRLKQELKG